MERKAHCFVIDLPHSDGCFVKAYPAETTEAFLDGHVSAFSFLGGVPRSILYDNTKLAVAKILGGRSWGMAGVNAPAPSPNSSLTTCSRTGSAAPAKAFEGVNIELTRAAPSTVSVDRALAYLAEFRAEEQEELSEKYRRWLERREERRRSTPPPLRRFQTSH